MMRKLAKILSWLLGIVHLDHLHGRSGARLRRLQVVGSPREIVQTFHLFYTSAKFIVSDRDGLLVGFYAHVSRQACDTVVEIVNA